VPGHVDVVIASELMEAGRALQRGLVDAERTTFIAASGRVYSTAEKMAMGDGRVNSDTLTASVRAAAQHVVLADFAGAAAQAGSVVSAALFGALAATGALPYGADDFRATIRDAGVGTEASLRAFEAGHALAQRPATAAAAAPAARAADADAAASAEPAALALAFVRARLGASTDAEVLRLAAFGVQRLSDYQDAAYATEYVDRLRPFVVHGPALAGAVARHLALWMSYDDVIRVADLKTRGTRFARLAGEARRADDGVVKVVEYFHPRVEEVADLLPPALGRSLLQPGWLHELLSRATNRGRTVQTSSLGGFLLLRTLAGLRRWRRRTLRHTVEQQRIADWLRLVADTAPRDTALALSLAEAQSLVKGYGDTHRRGLDSFARVVAVLPRLHGRAQPAEAVRTLCRAALADDQGLALQRALAEVGA
jgi:indolepyruvate ferredoxin oxidoreductase, beta subunit